jgi:soluble lytic murein transglycosylase
VRYAESEEAAGARYWSGRSHLRLADTAVAQEHWRWLLEHEPLSWYAAAGALRLGDGTTPWAPPEAAEEYRRYADLDSALARAELLRKVGMSHEARLELDWLARQATNDPDTERLLAVANALRAAGEKERSIELGRRAIARGHADARAYRFVYPIVEGELIATEAAKRGVDPALVAAVIRQESGFNPRATSPVGARGMMQMMPRVARALARSEKITPWDPALLYRPEINVRLGVAHLKAFVAHYDHPARALAAYNAGGSRVARWSKRAGAKDPELFIERIRFEETRDYVRIVLRNRDMYRALYEW